MSEIAQEFDGMVDELIEIRLETGAKAEEDITVSLVHHTVWGRPLSHEEFASVLRNWIVGGKIGDSNLLLDIFSGRGGGQLAKVKDALNKEIAYAYDANGNMTKVTDALSRETDFFYGVMKAWRGDVLVANVVS